MTALQEVIRLKKERQNASLTRQDLIDQRCRELADQLNQQEAEFVVKKYESYRWWGIPEYAARK